MNDLINSHFYCKKSVRVDFTWTGGWELKISGSIPVKPSIKLEFKITAIEFDGSFTDENN